MATRHYVDRRGFKHPVVDNSAYLEYLNPQNRSNVTVSGYSLAW